MLPSRMCTLACRHQYHRMHERLPDGHKNHLGALHEKRTSAGSPLFVSIRLCPCLSAVEVACYELEHLLLIAVDIGTQGAVGV